MGGKAISNSRGAELPAGISGGKGKCIWRLEQHKTVKVTIALCLAFLTIPLNQLIAGSTIFAQGGTLGFADSQFHNHGSN
jgi:hypothetical protein